MRNLLFLLFFAPFTVLASQGTNNPGLEAITKAIGAGDVESLAKYFDESLDVSILDSEKSYSKAQATEVVKNFLPAINPVPSTPFTTEPAAAAATNTASVTWRHPTVTSGCIFI